MERWYRGPRRIRGETSVDQGEIWAYWADMANILRTVNPARTVLKNPWQNVADITPSPRHEWQRPLSPMSQEDDWTRNAHKQWNALIIAVDND